MDHNDRGLCLITHADVEDLHWARVVFWRRGLPSEELAPNLPLFSRAHYSVSQRCNARRADPSISASITEWRKEGCAWLACRDLCCARSFMRDNEKSPGREPGDSRGNRNLAASSQPI